MDGPLEENNSPFIIWQGSHEMPADFGTAPSKREETKHPLIYSFTESRKQKTDNSAHCQFS